MAGHRARSGDDANAEVFLELLEEDEGEHRVRNQADACGDETLQQKFGIRLLYVVFSHCISQLEATMTSQIYC